MHWFRHSAPYINALHRHAKPFVLMFGGEAVLHENFQHIIHDIALLIFLGFGFWCMAHVRKSIESTRAKLNPFSPKSS